MGKRLTREEILEAVRAVKYPEKNDYYSLSSADGFAFLGAAKACLGVFPEELHQVVKRRYRLNAPNRIRNQLVPADAYYTYTLWPCAELFIASGERSLLEDLINILGRMGYYRNGLYAYCNVPIDYVVPNATPCAAWLYCSVWMVGTAMNLLVPFLDRQMDGNWEYTNENETEVFAREDSAHLSFIVYLLKEVAPFFAGNPLQKRLEEAVNDSLDVLLDMNRKEIQMGSCGWGPGFLMAARHYDEELRERAFEAAWAVLKDEKANFRARAVSAWAFSRFYPYEGERAESWATKKERGLTRPY